MNFNIKLRRFIAKYFGVLIEWIYEVKFKWISFNKPPIIILTPGKVGSSSVYYTLKKKLSNQVFHIHNLSEQGIKNSIDYHINSNRRSIPLHLIISKFLRKKLTNYSGELFVITIIREPISREISAFFQNTELYKDILENKNLEIDLTMAKELLYHRLGLNICQDLKDWFDLEIFNNFQIDVFKNTFDREKKYVISNNENYHHLLLKTEDLDAIFPGAIMEFLNLKEPMLLRKANVGDQKHYADIYKKVKKNIKLKPQIINQIVNSTFFQHFYSEDKQSVIDKWSQK
jgi:hypothetical protein